MRTLFSDIDYCLQELDKVIETVSNKNTTEKEFNVAERVLCSIYLYCPEKIRSSVEAIMLDVSFRKFYFQLLWVKGVT